jgi:tRNA (guanine-N7-)-methyltransferase
MTQARRPFLDRDVSDYPMPDLNPYMKLHKDFGPPVLTATEAAASKGRWAEVFGRQAPLHVELGSGNGFYLSGMAARNPQQSWLGVEIRFKRVILCARKIQAKGIQNARICRYDAWSMSDLFDQPELSGLHVNHPDPWMKDQDEGKRLLSRPLAQWASAVLLPGAELRIKTDHLPNLDRWLDCAEGLPLDLVARSDDLQRSGPPWGADDVITNYQSKFISRGLPVGGVWMRRR